MNRVLSVVLAFAFVLLFGGCNTAGSEDAYRTEDAYQYDSSKPWEWVYDGCGDSLRVNWKFDPDHPTDRSYKIFDSVPVPALRIRDFGSHRDSLRTRIKVGIIRSERYYRNWVWVLNWDYRSISREESGKDYVESYRPFSCLTYGTPKIITQPKSETVNDGDSVRFEVVATDGTIDRNNDHNYYVWLVNGVQVKYHVTKQQFNIRADLSASGMRLQVIVDNGYDRVISKEIVLTVNAAKPRETVIRPFQIEQGATHDTVFDGFVHPDEAARFQAVARGTVTSYAWIFKGVAVGTSSPFLTLPLVTKADSGTILKCITTNSKGSDTATFILKIGFGPWLYTEFSGSPGHQYLIDFDLGRGTTLYESALDFYGLDEAVFDLVLVGSDTTLKLMTPRLAMRTGNMGKVFSDSNLLATTKLVVISDTTITQDSALAVFNRSPKTDSVSIVDAGRGSEGYFQGDVTKSVLLKSSSGRMILLLPRITNIGYGLYYFRFRQGSVRP